MLFVFSPKGEVKATFDIVTVEFHGQKCSNQCSQDTDWEECPLLSKEGKPLLTQLCCIRGGRSGLLCSGRGAVGIPGCGNVGICGRRDVGTQGRRNAGAQVYWVCEEEELWGCRDVGMLACGEIWMWGCREVRGGKSSQLPRHICPACLRMIPVPSAASAPTTAIPENFPNELKPTSLEK